MMTTTELDAFIRENHFTTDELKKYPHTFLLIDQWERNGFRDKQHAISHSLSAFKRGLRTLDLDESKQLSYKRLIDELLLLLKKDIYEDIEKCTH